MSNSLINYAKMPRLNKRQQEAFKWYKEQGVREDWALLVVTSARHCYNGTELAGALGWSDSAQGLKFWVAVKKASADLTNLCFSVKDFYTQNFPEMKLPEWIAQEREEKKPINAVQAMRIVADSFKRLGETMSGGIPVSKQAVVVAESKPKSVVAPSLSQTTQEEQQLKQKQLQFLFNAHALAKKAAGVERVSARFIVDTIRFECPFDVKVNNGVAKQLAIECVKQHPSLAGFFTNKGV